MISYGTFTIIIIIILYKKYKIKWFSQKMSNKYQFIILQKFEVLC